jgi:hypothetical protein
MLETTCNFFISVGAGDVFYTMKLSTITIDDILEWGPCYDPTDVVGDDWSGSALDVIALYESGHISASDALWVVLRSEVLPDHILHDMGRWCALQVIDLWDAPEVVREYLETGNQDLCQAAESASWSACWSASDPAVQDAAESAACSAAQNAGSAARAACFAAGDATETAACFATETAAETAAGAAQMEYLKSLLGAGEK